MHLYEVLRKPLITEKNTFLQEIGQYAFEVDARATKTQVKQAVEKAFKVNVTGVRVMTVTGKRRRARNGVTVARPSWKKALVSLKTGDKITYFEGV